ncbi:MAG: SMI1/KNR4 family protein [Actinomycetaceae bacterium]|nr:SMI1/KNR4 family protein [Actinomycetaceae bacterium]
MSAYLADSPSQIQRIRRKLEDIRLADPHRKCGWACVHDYLLEPPLAEDDIRQWESHYGLTLPDGYRAFVTQVGNGGPARPGHWLDQVGAGPGRGVYSLGSEAQWLEIENLESEQLEVLREHLDSGDNDCSNPEARHGIVPMAPGECDEFYVLVCSGEHKGAVVEIDPDEFAQPRLSRIIAGDFLSWYESWLDQVLKQTLDCADSAC